MKSRLALLSVLSLCVGLLVSQTALAMSYGDYFGTNVNFMDVNDVTQTAGDPDGLFGSPTVSGNELTFFPSNFTATTAGASGFDQTGALLNITLEAAGPSDIITNVIIDEFGDFLFAGGPYSSLTNVSLTISGTLTVLEDINGAIPSQTITFSSTGDFVPVISPEADGAFIAPDYGSGSFSWSGVLDIDVASVVPDATVAELQLNNFLFAFSEAGTSATIQKKDAGIGITVVPEPTTGLLALGGLVALAIRSRRQRA